MNEKQENALSETVELKRGNPWALLPVGVFLLVYIGAGIVFGDFYLMSVVVAFMVALIVAFVQNRGLKLEQKFEVMARGLADKNIVMMILIFLFAGMFAGVVGRDGAVSVANLMLKFIPARFSVVAMFLVACFISIAMGTSLGTIAILAPIGFELSHATGISGALIVATIVGGAMFGDNLSFISDTTIAATGTQGCKMKDKFKENFFIALPAALMTVVILVVMALIGDDVEAYTPNFINLWLILPYVLVLIGGIVGINVFVVLFAGIVSSVAIKLVLGYGIVNVISGIGSGASGMFEVIIVTVQVSMLAALMREYGGFDALLYFIKKIFKGRVGGQLGISALVAAMDVATANNTVAIVMAAPIAKQISEEYDITSKRTASLLDIFGSVMQGILPYGAQIITASALTVVGGIEMLPYMFYPYLLTVSAIISMFIKEKKAK